MESDFQIKDRDLAARTGVLKTGHGKIETPTIFPVINPSEQVIPASSMPGYGADAVITNAYLLWKNHTGEVLGRGIHGFLGFDGPVMTDSGAFQLMEYGSVEVSNEEIIDFQKKIGVDIGVMLDVPTAGSDHATTKAGVEETIARAKVSDLAGSDVLWCGPVQGGIHRDLLIRSCREMGAMDFAIHPVGSVVPLLMQYRYTELMGIMKTAKEALPQDRPLHLFGAGHPMFFAFAVAMGFDFFDSAAYALYAKDDRYMTVSGTEQLPELEYFPCCCPVCSSMTPQELRASDDRQKLLAQHNLHVTFQEIRTIRQAIRERTLWELLEQRARAHPNLLAAMREFARYGKFLGKYDPITKKHFFVLSEFSRKRPDVVAARRRCRNVRGASVTLKPFGRVPQSVFECYPFSQTVPGIEKPKTRNDRQKLRDVSLYWFGEDVFPEKVRIDVSRATGKMRAAYDSKGGLLAVVRPNDFMLLLHGAAKKLHKGGKSRVVVSDEVQEFIKQGKSVFAKHVVSADAAIVPDQQVIVVNENGELLAAGDALLNAQEMADFRRGAAVSVRWSVSPTRRIQESP